MWLNTCSPFQLWCFVRHGLQLTDNEASHLSIRGFTHYFTCRDSKQEHGGVSVFVKCDMKVKVLARQQHPDIVLLSIGNKELLLGACYFSPHYPGQPRADPFEALAVCKHSHPTHKHTVVLLYLKQYIQTL